MKRPDSDSARYLSCSMTTHTVANDIKTQLLVDEVIVFIALALPTYVSERGKLHLLFHGESIHRFTLDRSLSCFPLADSECLKKASFMKLNLEKLHFPDQRLAAHLRALEFTGRGGYVAPKCIQR